MTHKAPILGLDFETYSYVTPQAVGSDAYAAHETTGIHCAVFSLSKAPGDHRLHYWWPGEKLPNWIVDHIRGGELVLAHNVSFELSMIRYLLAPEYGWPEPKLTQWRDTAAYAAIHSLPQSLEGLCAAIGAKVQKDMEGNALMRKLAKVTKDRKTGAYNYPVPSDAELARLTDYCEVDVICMLDCWWRLPRPSFTELAIMQADLRVNTRGVYIDLPFARAMDEMGGMRERAIGRQAGYDTEDLVSLTGVPAVKKWLKDQGVKLPLVQRRTKKANGDVEVKESESLDRATVAALLADPDQPDTVKAVLEGRSEVSRVTSLAKLTRVEKMVSADARLRFALRYGGAHTGRWSSKGLQVHNLPKSRLGAAEGPLRDAVRAGDLEAATTAWPNVLQGLSFLLRSVVASAPGCELIGADYSAIEARVLAWLAGQQDVLDVFESGRDIYVEDAARIGSDDRQLGKVQRLALGYGMGAIKFRDTAAGYGVALALKRAREVQQLWRKNNPAIVSFWHDLQDAVADAVAERGATFPVGEHITVRATKNCLRIYLPSGRALHYWRPHQKDVVREIETVDDDGNIEVNEVPMRELRFYKPTGKGMMVESTYGGKLTENVTQAVARDLLGRAMLTLEHAGYKVVMHVHDSLVAEVPKNRGDVDEFCALLTEIPVWAAGLPIAAEGYRANHFKG